MFRKRLIYFRALPKKSGRIVFATFLIIALSFQFVPKHALAAVTFRSASTAQTGSGATSITLNTPAGAVAGDMLVAIVSANTGGDANASISTQSAQSSGWNSIGTTDATNLQTSSFMFYMNLSSTPAASYTFNFITYSCSPSCMQSTATLKAAGILADYSGVSSVSAINASSYQSNTSPSTTMTAPSITPTTQNTMIIAAYGAAGAYTVTAGSGTTLRGTVNTTGGGSSSSKATAALEDIPQAAATATGTVTATASAATTSMGAILALRPPVALNQASYKFFTNQDSADPYPDWSQISTTTAFGAREMPLNVSFNNQLWAMSGYSGGPKNDVWNSSDGINWTQATAAAPWAARYGFSAYSYAGKLWVAGGYSPSGGGFKNDVWSSTDGTNWTQVTSAAPWSSRDFPGGIVFGNKMLLLAGNGASSLNDVWSSTDGLTWTQETAAAPWAGRYWMQPVTLNGKLLVMGGYNGSSYFNDVWVSSDGSSWSNITNSAPWKPRSSFGIQAFNGIYYLYFGRDASLYSDVWTYSPGADYATPQIDVGAPIAAINTLATVPASGQPFRLRIDIGVPASSSSLSAGFQSYNLQYALRGMDNICDTAFTGETYTNVTNTSPVGFYDNTNAGNGEPLISNQNDPSDSGNTIVSQSYQEKGTATFSNTSTIPAGQDGMWDFALTTTNVNAGDHYCLRVVTNNGTPLTSYTTIPEIVIPYPNSAPNAPILSVPTSGATGVSVLPAFILSTTDPDGDYLRYKILLYQSDCSTPVGTFDQTNSQTGWSGQNTQAGSAYTSGSTATYTYTATLANNTTYCWQAAAIDPGGSNTWGSTSATQTFHTATASGGDINIRGGLNIRGGVRLNN